MNYLCIMFYRRKLILALLQAFGGKLEKINLQKLLFLTTIRQIKPDYEFIPFKFGCYSYSANADLTTMVKKGMLEETESTFSKRDKTNYLSLLKENDKKAVLSIYERFSNYSANDLMRYTYINNPYYAIHSQTAQSLLSADQLAKVAAERPRVSSMILYTIGYEGISLEEYLNRLIRHDVKVLIDVRNNPQSQKFGFSKRLLLRYCVNLGIEYLHFAEVGIQSEYRQELKVQADYDQLFDQYRKKTLKTTVMTQQKILHLLTEKKRVALTCYEGNICQCHRKHLAESITRLPGWEYELKHI